MLQRFIKHDAGSVPIEYAMIAILISIVAIGAMSAIGEKTVSFFVSVAEAFR